MRQWLLAAVVAVLASTSAHAETFAEFIRAFEAKAVAAGVTPETYRRASPIPVMIEHQLDRDLADATTNKLLSSIGASHPGASAPLVMRESYLPHK